MARNHNFFFDPDGTPRARGPASEKPLMTFLELDVQGSDHICRDLMDDLTAVEDETDDSREFNGNAHSVLITTEGVCITANQAPLKDPSTSAEADTAGGNPMATPPEGTPYLVGLKHFREVLEDWEAFILDDQMDDSLPEDDYL